jgi:hypothetical protein
MRQPSPDLMSEAAGGDLQALRNLAEASAYEQFPGVTSLECFVAAEAFGWLAAQHGEPDDVMRLAGILFVRAHHVAEVCGDLPRAATVAAQGDNLLNDLFETVPLSTGVDFLAGVLMGQAEAGDEMAAVRLTRLTELLSPSDADELRNVLNAAIEPLMRQAPVGQALPSRDPGILETR